MKTDFPLLFLLQIQPNHEEREVVYICLLYRVHHVKLNKDKEKYLTLIYFHKSLEHGFILTSFLRILK